MSLEFRNINEGAGLGTVTSVALDNITNFATASGTPIVGAGTLRLTLNAQAAKKAFIGPETGAAAIPTFRFLVEDDGPWARTTINKTTAQLQAMELGGQVVLGQQYYNVDIWSGFVADWRALFVGVTDQLGNTTLAPYGQLTINGAKMSIGYNLALDSITELYDPVNRVHVYNGSNNPILDIWSAACIGSPPGFLLTDTQLFDTGSGAGVAFSITNSTIYGGVLDFNASVNISGCILNGFSNQITIGGEIMNLSNCEIGRGCTIILPQTTLTLTNCTINVGAITINMSAIAGGYSRDGNNWTGRVNDFDIEAADIAAVNPSTPWDMASFACFGIIKPDTNGDITTIDNAPTTHDFWIAPAEAATAVNIKDNTVGGGNIHIENPLGTTTLDGSLRHRMLMYREGTKVYTLYSSLPFS